MSEQLDRIQMIKGLYLTGIASVIIMAVFIYQWVTGMQLDTGEILSVPIALGAFLSLVKKYRKLSLT
ncbi:hypothetical protein J31TS6_00150 [Brevibacillus reuszeri]|uniref:hypothetical protein n=1 Tax=Brevibacillus reuszeri TaxID=54915 RepID=UPI000CCBD746|nr:hypothetical protein [Brevibacillus reuszeri]GIO03987.1 hypothetical protein J31TS6_00150 [Brevibacillus reuszeri]